MGNTVVKEMFYLVELSDAFRDVCTCKNMSSYTFNLSVFYGS